MNAPVALPKSPSESEFLAELLAQTLALADTIAAAIDTSTRETLPAQPALSPIRRAEIAADARMRASVSAAMDREHARQMAEWAAMRPVPKRVAPPSLRPAPFALTPALVAKVIGSPAPAKGSVEVPISPMKLVDRPRQPENPTRPSTWRKRRNAWNDPVETHDGIPSELSAPSTCSRRTESSRAPAAIDEAQHCHSLTSADGHTEADGAPVSEAVAAECAERASRRAVARKTGCGVGKPLALSDLSFDQDAHESELRKIDRRPAIKTGEHAERRARQRAAEENKARRREMIAAAAEKLRLRQSEVVL